MSAVSKESEDEAEAAGTSSMMESSMMEGEEYYNPDTTVAWSEKVSGGEQLCRICAGPNEYLIPIFSGEGLEHQLGMKIEKHLPIQVLEHDKLPVQVCYQCASTLIAWHDLVVGCVEAEKKLRQLYQQQNVEEEEEEDDFGDDDRTELFADPVDSEMAEDPLEPSTSTSTATRSTRSPRKKSVTRAKPKLKMTLVKTPAALPKSPPKLLQPKEEQVEADPATERIEEMEFCNTYLPISESDSVRHRTNSGPLGSKVFAEDSSRSGSPGDTRVAVRANVFPNEAPDKTCPKKPAILPNKKAAHIICYFVQDGLSRKIRHSSCSACGSNGIPSADLVLHLQFKCVPSMTSESIEHSGINVGTSGISFKMIDSGVPRLVRGAKTKVDDVDLSNTSNVIISDPLALDHNYQAIESMTKKSVLLEKSRPIRKSRSKNNNGIKKVVKTIVQCRICFKRCSSETDLEKHKQVHEENKCKICNIYLIRKKEQETHYKQHVVEHPEEPTVFLCPTCGEVFQSYKTFHHHNIKRHTAPTHTCDICGFKCSFSRQFKEHMLRHTNVRPFMCETCGRGFFKRAEMIQHQRVHSDARPHGCTECEASFKSASRLRNHEILLHDKKFENKTVFTCIVCDQRCVTKSRLSDHMNSHTGERPYDCNLCEKTFRSKHTLYQHKAVHKSKTYKFACDACEKKCNTRSLLNKHKRMYHVTNNLESKFLCENCGKSFDSKAGVFRHNYFVHKLKRGKIHKERCRRRMLPNTFSCDDCNENFPSKRNLLCHLSYVHKKEGVYSCTECDRAYTTQNRLNNHMTASHSDTVDVSSMERAYACTHCEETFRNQNGLNKHCEALHPGSKFSCCDCNKNYKSSASLYNHRRLMHMQVECVCTTCGKVCLGEYSLARHILIHREKKFSCEFCGRMMRRQWDLDTHVRIHTGEKPYSCTICDLSFAQLGTRNQHMQNIHKTNYVAS